MVELLDVASAEVGYPRANMAAAWRMLFRPGGPYSLYDGGLIPPHRLEQVSGHDAQRWMVHLLTRYSNAYASNQFRALQQFFRWLAEEQQLADPMARLRVPR